MVSYIVTKKCFAKEFVSVDAENKEEAKDKAFNNECKIVVSRLEFNGYQEKELWEVERSDGKED